MSARRFHPCVLVVSAVLTLAGLSACCLAQAQAQAWQAAISPNNSLDFGILCGGQARMGIALAGWGPKWSYKGLSAKDKAVDGVLTCKVPFVVDQAGGQVIDVTFQARQSGPR